jgi:hypothetical protein
MPLGFFTPLPRMIISAYGADVFSLAFQDKEVRHDKQHMTQIHAAGTVEYGMHISHSKTGLSQ